MKYLQKKVKSKAKEYTHVGHRPSAANFATSLYMTLVVVVVVLLLLAMW